MATWAAGRWLPELRPASFDKMSKNETASLPAASGENEIRDPDRMAATIVDFKPEALPAAGFACGGDGRSKEDGA